MNAVSTAMAGRCRGHAALARTTPVRCVVLTSTHAAAFCVGADLKERNSFTDADLRRQRPVARAAYGSVLDAPVPAIAAVDGFALGGGFEIALSCDLVVAGAVAVVGLPEVSVGVIPGGGGTQLLARRVGWSRAAPTDLHRRTVDAEDASGWGGRRAGRAGTARARALELAATIAGNSPVGLRDAKRAMRLGPDVDLAAGLEVEDAGWRATAFSGDRREGVAAFARSAALWPGR